MATGLLLDKRLSVRTLRDSRIVVDEAACTGATFTTLLNPDGDGKNYRLGTWLVSGCLAVLAAGKAQTLLVSGGPGGQDSAGGVWTQQGSGGRVLTGESTIPVGMHAVTVGVKGTSVGGVNGIGLPSKIGTLLNTGAAPTFGDGGMGAGSQVYGDQLGLVSSITGTAVEYAPGRTGPANPGRGTIGGGSTQADGIVIVRWEI